MIFLLNFVDLPVVQAPQPNETTKAIPVTKMSFARLMALENRKFIWWKLNKSSHILCTLMNLTFIVVFSARETRRRRNRVIYETDSMPENQWAGQNYAKVGRAGEAIELIEKLSRINFQNASSGGK